MNELKRQRIDQIEEVMRNSFTADQENNFDVNAWAEKVMADVRRQTFDEADNLRLISRAAWFALAASMLLAFVVYFTSNGGSNFKSYDLLTGEQVSIESAYRN